MNGAGKNTEKKCDLPQRHTEVNPTEKPQMLEEIFYTRAKIKIVYSFPIDECDIKTTPVSIIVVLRTPIEKAKMHK